MHSDQRTRAAFAYVSQPLLVFWGATSEQINEVYEAYTNLWASTPLEEQARDIFDSLVAIVLVDEVAKPIDWLIREIRFEAFVVSTGDRAWAALMEFEYGKDVPKAERLTLYQERLDRKL